MRSWRAFVADHLVLLGEDRAKSSQVAEELAEHLEDYYEDLRAKGIPEERAFKETCRQVGNWEELRRGINLANQEGTMTDRVKQIWVPTFLTLLLSAAALTILIWAGVQPKIWHPGEACGVILYLPWLLFLPLTGGVGAYLSRRAKGSGWRVYLSGLSPALAWAVVFLVVSPFAFLVNPAVEPSLKVTSILAMVVSWVILPGLALGIGVAIVAGMKTQPAKI